MLAHLLAGSVVFYLFKRVHIKGVNKVQLTGDIKEQTTV